MAPSLATSQSAQARTSEAWRESVEMLGNLRNENRSSREGLTGGSWRFRQQGGKAKPGGSGLGGFHCGPIHQVVCSHNLDRRASAAARASASFLLLPLPVASTSPFHETSAWNTRRWSGPLSPTIR